MDKIKFLFVDTEFTELSRDAELISVGIVGAKGSLYIEFPSGIQKINNSDNDWMKENVIGNLLPVNDLPENIIVGKASNKHEFQDQLIEFLSNEVDKPFECYKWQFVSDCCHYDAMLLFELLMEEDTALSLPDFIVPSMLDIDTLISQHEREINGSYSKPGFDISREDLINMLDDKLPGLSMKIPDFIANKKHNALYDAYVIKKIFEGFCYEM